MRRFFPKYRSTVLLNAGLLVVSPLAYWTTQLATVENLWYKLLPVYPLIVATKSHIGPDPFGIST